MAYKSYKEVVLPAGKKGALKLPVQKEGGPKPREYHLGTGVEAATDVEPTLTAPPRTVSTKLKLPGERQEPETTREAPETLEETAREETAREAPAFAEAAPEPGVPRADPTATVAEWATEDVRVPVPDLHVEAVQLTPSGQAPSEPTPSAAERFEEPTAPSEEVRPSEEVSRSEDVADSVTEPAPELQTEPAPELQTEPASESEAEPAPAPETEPASESETEPAPAPETEPASESETAPAPEKDSSPPPTTVAAAPAEDHEKAAPAWLPKAVPPSPTQRDFIVGYAGTIIGHYRSSRRVSNRTALLKIAQELQQHIDDFDPAELELFKPVPIHVERLKDVPEREESFTWFADETQPAWGPLF